MVYGGWTGVLLGVWTWRMD